MEARDIGRGRLLAADPDVLERALVGGGAIENLLMPASDCALQWSALRFTVRELSKSLEALLTMDRPGKEGVAINEHSQSHSEDVEK